MSPASIALVLVVAFGIPTVALLAWEYVLNRRLARGLCLCGKRQPCHGGCR